METIVIHELGHALGLGHSPNSSSVMYATLDPGTTKRVLTSADLNVPDTDNGPCALHAAPADVRVPSSAYPNTESANTAALTPFSNDLGWVAKWAWLALGLGGNHDPISATADLGADADAGGDYPSSRSGYNLSSAGLGSNRNASRYTDNAPTSGSLTSENDGNLGSALGDDADAVENADGSALFDEPVDVAVLDQLFEQFGSGADEGAADMAGDF